MKKFFKYFGIGLAIFVGSVALALGGHMAWKFYLSTLEGWAWAGFIAGIMLILVGLSELDDGGVWGIFFGACFFVAAIFVPRTGQKRIECVEWSKDKREEIRTHSDGTQYYEPPREYCIEKQKQIRIDGEWKEVKDGI